MKIVFLMALSLFCSVNAMSQNKGLTECQKKIDSLSQILIYIKYGIFEIDLHRFSIEKYNNFTFQDFKEKDIPFDKDEQRFLEFSLYIEHLFANKECVCEWNKKEFIDAIGGTETEKNYKNGLFLLLNFGHNCPLRTPIEPGFGSFFTQCGKIELTFDSNDCFKSIKTYY